jgi:hypothetical protein
MKKGRSQLVGTTRSIPDVGQAKEQNPVYCGLKQKILPDNWN